MNNYFGLLFGWAETGTEGFIWSIQWEKYLTETYWDYAGLVTVKRGDYLIIYDDKERSNIVWEGVIVPVFMESISNIRTHWSQKGINPVQWANWFMEEKYWGDIRTERDFS